MIPLPPTPVAIVDDEEDMRASIAQWMELSGFIPAPFENGLAALDAIGADFSGVVITDVRMPEMDGMALLGRLLERDPDLPVILITGHGDVPMAVEAMRVGAYDFLEKPFNPDRLTDLVRRAAEARRLVLENRALRRERADGSALLRQIAGESPVIRRLREDILDGAATGANVLIQGETGTGKTLIARALHGCSPSAEGPFITLNCAALPEDAPIAALHDRLVAARGGTLFLDEVTALPPALQPHLVDALHDTSTGAPRIISAAPEGTDEAIADGRLRKDLYFRLAAMELVAPPLRDRGEDILLLFDLFAQSLAAEHDATPPALSADDAATLLQFPWPGNVRQLRNLAERAVLRAKRGPVILAELLDPVAPSGTEQLPQDLRPLKDHVEAFERMMIRNALRRHRGSITEVMEELALPRRTLNEKMARYAISRSDFV
ncbi:sigma-54 dependent transcriptional regulator [Oceanicella sp. SM1341]|uniref:sigma-54-dependent transcriptional regulator n=1 Tax=Oceanicella sp. SM1341 TaxID=1548889 RepID=UPI000E4CD810|nr:sigma-54 dependent transcriptional regulator [Oceanicella sp. SM1341]